MAASFSTGNRWLEVSRSRTDAGYYIKVTYTCYYAFAQRLIFAISAAKAEICLREARRFPYLGASIEPMLNDHRASVFLALTVALTITVTWRA